MGEIKEILALDDRRVVELSDRFGGGRFSALQRILSMALANGARSLAIEENPPELEYAAEYKALFQYVTTYRDRKAPRRLHLFADEILNPGDITAEARYLGFLDLRPFNEPSICWAVLDRAILCGLDGIGRYLYVTCSREYRHDVAGFTFKWVGFPYLQQDGFSVRCAQAALATIADFLGCTLPGPKLTDLTALESPHAEREIPSPGLTPRQICIGIRAMKREPLLYTFEGKQPPWATLLQLIYPYIESEIPVLMGIRTRTEAHALVAIGHTFTPDSWMSYSESAYYGLPDCGLSTAWVRRLVVQDDNFGPYTLIPTEALDNLCFLVAVPLPPHVFLTADHAIPIAQHFLYGGDSNSDAIQVAYDRIISDELRKQRAAFDDHTGFWVRQLRNAVVSRNLILRPRLVSGESFLREQAGGVGEEAASRIPIPEHVWRIEISWPQVFCHRRLRVGELVLDATHPWRVQQPASRQGWLWLRIPGALIWHNLSTSEAGALCLPNDSLPEPHFKHG